MLVTTLLLQGRMTVLAAIPPKSQWQASASALQEPIYPANHICDGNPDTRWSSPAKDPQWIEIDLIHTCQVSGIKILWETAFSTAYRIETSQDAQHWITVYATEHGDGNTDYVFFRPHHARLIRIHGLKRATGWGHSIREIDLFNQPFSATPATNRTTPLVTQALVDGDPKTTQPSPASIIVTLPATLPLGGLQINWGSNYARHVQLETSLTVSNWQTASVLTNGEGRFDLLHTPPFDAARLRLSFSDLADSNALLDVADIILRGPSERLTPLAEYQAAARKAPTGWYPESLHGRQVYWTVLGAPRAASESLLDEYGNIEPRAKGSTLMPFVECDSRLYSALDATLVEQHLESGFLPMPSVRWSAGPLSLNIDTFAWGATTQSFTLARYTLTNNRSNTHSGSFFLAARPVQINPSWQYGGLADIQDISCIQTSNWSGFDINQQPVYRFYPAAQSYGVRAYDRGDVVRDIAAQSISPTTHLSNPNDPRLSGAQAWPFELKPGDTLTVLALMPHGDTMPRIFAPNSSAKPLQLFSQLRKQTAAYWSDQVLKTVLELPDTNLVNTLRSQLAYILINGDGPAIQPGSRQYERSWIRDGSMTAMALLRWGVSQPVHDFIEWYTHFITPEGMVPPSFHHTDPLDSGPGSGIEWDGQGAYIALVMEYYRFTDDREWLKAHFDVLVQVMNYLEKLRHQTLSDDYMADQPHPERFHGILPKSFSHEGYYPEMHSYWDDFWALRGWRDGADAALILGKTNIALWANRQYDLLATSLSNSIQATMDYHDIDHIPGCAEKGDFDPTSTSIAFFPCTGSNLLPKDALQAMYDRYYNEVQERLDPSWQAGFTPYEVRNIQTFIRLGQPERAHELLAFLMNCRRPAAWNHLAEVVLSDSRMGCYIGDMPHTWVGSGLLNNVALMLVREDDQYLHLLDGAPSEWFKGNGIRLHNRPTPWGNLNIEAHQTRDAHIHIKLSGSAAPPNGFRLYWPAGFTPDRAIINDGEPQPINNAWLDIPASGQTRSIELYQTKGPLTTD